MYINIYLYSHVPVQVHVHVLYVAGALCATDQSVFSGVFSTPWGKGRQPHSPRSDTCGHTETGSSQTTAASTHWREDRERLLTQMGGNLCVGLCVRPAVCAS